MYKCSSWIVDLWRQRWRHECVSLAPLRAVEWLWQGSLHRCKQRFYNSYSCHIFYYVFNVFILSMFLRARRYMLTGVFARTIMSVCPSVTRQYFVKTKISSLSSSPTILVFWCRISSRHFKGSPPSGGLKQGWGGKIQPFSSFNHQYLENSSR